MKTQIFLGLAILSLAVAQIYTQLQLQQAKNDIGILSVTLGQAGILFSNEEGELIVNRVVRVIDITPPQEQVTQ